MIKKIIFGKKCVCDIEKRERKYGHKLNVDYCNGKWFMNIHIFIDVWLYLKYENKGKSSSYYNYIKLLYSHVLVFHFFYKIYMTSTPCFSLQNRPSNK